MPTREHDHLAMKIGRAYTHLLEFDRLLVQYCTSNPYDGTSYEDAANRRYVITVTPKPFHGEIPLSLADAAYSLRSGLDQLAWQLARLKVERPSRQTAFPIYPDQSTKNEQRFKARVQDIPPEAVEIIRELQPYHSPGNFMSHPLWQLNELCNMDKHRLPAVRAHFAKFDVRPLGYVREEIQNATAFSWPLEQKSEVALSASPPDLFFGDPILEPADPDRPPFEIDRMQVAEIYRFVREDVAPRFDRFFV